jgi:hypothetical protein
MIKILNTQQKDYDGRKIIVGEIDGISKELSDLIREVKSCCKKSLLFADKNQVPQLKDMVFAVGDHPQGIVVYFMIDYSNQYYIEYGIAHELMHMKLKYSNVVPELNIRYPDPLKMNISIIVCVVQDFLVDNELEKRGFQNSQIFMQEIRDTLERLKNKKSIDNLIREVGIYAQFFAFQPEVIKKAKPMELKKRNYIKLKKIYENKFPEVFEKGNKIIAIIRENDIYTEDGYKKCVQKVIDTLRTDLGIEKISFT